MSSQRRAFQAPSTALTAGAFQDQLMQDLSLGNLSLNAPLQSYSNLKQKLRTDERKRRHALKNVKPTVDTGRIKKSATKQKEDPEKEYVLDPLPKPSLAQRLGLVSQPDKPLSNEEWSSVKQRSIARDDFKNPCAICQEFFKEEDQVLLSCSHVFHRACIQAFERFTGRKSCPMCRKIQYQARVVHDGTRAYREKAATKIQTTWRGYIVRKWYRKLRRTVPPRDANLRRKFYEEKLQEITDRMVAMASSESVDRFLQDIDHSVACSRAIFQHFEDSQLHRLSEDDWVSIEVKTLQRDDTDCPICLRHLHPNKETQPSLSKGNVGRGDESPSVMKSQARSMKSASATGRKSSLKKPKSAERMENDDERPERHTLALLSCSHLFHAKCLEALEDFCIMDSSVVGVSTGTGSPGRVYTTGSSVTDFNNGLHFKCPVCRSLYVKRILY